MSDYEALKRKREKRYKEDRLAHKRACAARKCIREQAKERPHFTKQKDVVTGAPKSDWLVKGYELEPGQRVTVYLKNGRKTDVRISAIVFRDLDGVVLASFERL